MVVRRPARSALGLRKKAIRGECQMARMLVIGIVMQPFQQGSSRRERFESANCVRLETVESQVEHHAGVYTFFANGFWFHQNGSLLVKIHKSVSFFSFVSDGL